MAMSLPQLPCPPAAPNLGSQQLPPAVTPRGIDHSSIASDIPTIGSASAAAEPPLVADAADRTDIVHNRMAIDIDHNTATIGSASAPPAELLLYAAASDQSSTLAVVPSASSCAIVNATITM